MKISRKSKRNGFVFYIAKIGTSLRYSYINPNLNIIQCIHVLASTWYPINMHNFVLKYEVEKVLCVAQYFRVFIKSDTPVFLVRKIFTSTSSSGIILHYETPSFDVSPSQLPPLVSLGLC